jgi:signal transduction histidine kinase
MVVTWESFKGHLTVTSLAFILLYCTRSSAQQTTCFASLQGGDEPFAHMLSDDANVLIGQLQARLEPNSPLARPSRARLYAMLADAYYVIGDDTAAREAALSGIAALTATDGEPLQHRLTLSSIYYLGEMGQLEKAATEYEAAAALVPNDAPDLACVLEIRGYMRYRSLRIVEAATDLVHAAQLAKDRGSERYQLDAESVLSMLYANNGLYEEAHALVSDAIAAGLRTGDLPDQANAYFRRGDVYLLQGNLAAAAADFRHSAALSRSIGQPTVAAQADERLCTTLAGTRQYDEARASCLAAIRETTVAKDPESTKLAYAALGQIELGSNHLQLAATQLNRALLNDGADMPPRQVARFRRLRGEVRASLGDTVGALADDQAYLAWLDKEGSTRKAAQMAMARAKFDTAIAEEKVARLRAQADADKLVATRARLITNIVMLTTALIVSMAASAWWFWRRRREVAHVRLAAEERFATIGRLTAGIAHEFNNQLTVVQHALSLLARRPATRADATSQLLIRELEQSTQTSASITAQLNSFGRQQNLNPQSLAIDAFFEKIAPILTKAAGDRVSVRLEVTAPSTLVWADERQLTEALINLVDNAKDAMPAGGTVRITAEPGTGSYTIVRVIDQGSGMSDEILARATEPFFTTKPLGAGTGLGVSMVEGFVTQSGGSMTIESVLHEGTAVTLRLPNRRDAP